MGILRIYSSILVIAIQELLIWLEVSTARIIDGFQLCISPEKKKTY